MTTQLKEMRMQDSIELIIGSERPIRKAVKDDIIKEICKSCGGCTVLNSTGYWIEEAGEVRKASYEGNVVTEDTLHVQLTSETNKTQHVYGELQAIVKDAKLVYGLDIKWVHCKVSTSRGAHFEV